MKNQLSHLLLLAVGLFTFGCLPQGIDPILVLTPDTPITYATEGGMSFVNVETNLSDWDVTSSESKWCAVAKLSDGKSFSISASKYFGKNPRTAIVTVNGVVGWATKPASITVTQTGVDLDPFILTIDPPTVSGVTVGITPADKQMRYYFEVISKDSVTTTYKGELSRYMVAVKANALAKTGGDVERALNLISSVGDKSFIYDTLWPNKEYLAFVVGLDDEIELSTRIVHAGFKTLKKE